MFRKKRLPVACSVCGKAIDPRERRFVEKNRISKVERHTHIDCQKSVPGHRSLP